MKKHPPRDENKQLSEKIIPFKRDTQIIDELAEELLDENDVFGSIALLLEIEKSGKGEHRLFQRIADLYTELGMFDRSINYWFKFLDSAPKKYRAEAYNGLGGNYFFAGNDKLAAYYFNLQISDKGDDDYPFDDAMYELFSPLMEKDDRLKVVDKRGIEDESTLDKARQLIEEENPFSAITYLSKIKKGSPCYGEASYLLATVFLFILNLRSALDFFKIAKEEGFKEDDALTNMLGISVLLAEKDIQKATFDELKTKGCIVPESTIKYFILCEGVKRYDCAYEFFKMLEELLPDYGMLRLFGGFAAFNVGEYDEAAKLFGDFYKITGENYAEGYMKLARKYAEKPHKSKPILNAERGYQPADLEKALSNMEQYVDDDFTVRGNQKKAIQCANVCFFDRNSNMRGAALQLLCEVDLPYAMKIMRECLMDVTESDELKLFVLSMLVQYGQEEPIGAVIENLYSRVPFERVEFNDGCGEVFRAGYAFVFGRVAPFCENEAYKLRVAAYELYDKLLSNGNARKIKSPGQLAVAIFKRSKIKLFDGLKELYDYFGVTAASVARIERLAEEE